MTEILLYPLSNLVQTMLWKSRSFYLNSKRGSKNVSKIFLIVVFDTIFPDGV